MLKIYHNNRCGKSRSACKIVEEKGVEAEIIEYLKTPLNASEIKELLKKLSMNAESLIRKGEKIFKENYKGKDLSESEWIDAMAENPILIERPIIVKGDKAVLGRPPENVLELL